MSKICLTIPGFLANGKQISFVAPCDSADATCFTINNDEYTICNAKDDNLAGTDGIWASGAIVSVIVNTETKKAYIQNAATSSQSYEYGTTDLVAGTSPLATGKLYFVYE